MQTIPRTKPYPKSTELTDTYPPQHVLTSRKSVRRADGCSESCYLRLCLAMREDFLVTYILLHTPCYHPSSLYADDVLRPFRNGTNILVSAVIVCCFCRELYISAINRNVINNVESHYPRNEFSVHHTSVDPNWELEQICCRTKRNGFFFSSF